MRKFFIAGTVLAISLASCQDDNTLFNELSPIRPYDADVRIMAQFVEMDSNTGMYVINPDKKITLSDYIVNTSREELLMVSEINRTRFLNEMEDINSQISVVRRSGLASAFIYATQMSDGIIPGKNTSSIHISRLEDEPWGRTKLANITLEDRKTKSMDLFANSEMVMTVNAANTSTFYCVQLTIGDQTNKDAETIIISGVKSNIPTHSYEFLMSSKLDENKTISGVSLIGAGIINLSFAK